jgi:Rab-GTPase-TBC domain
MVMPENKSYYKRMKNAKIHYPNPSFT